MYGGADGEATSTNTAVTATSGVVPMYGGDAHRGLLLLHLRRPHREHRERVAGRRGGALPQGRARPLRHDLALPQLARQPHPPHALVDRRGAGLRQGPAARRLRAQARHLAARGQGPADRRQGHGDHQRLPAALRPRRCATPGPTSPRSRSAPRLRAPSSTARPPRSPASATRRSARGRSRRSISFRPAASGRRARPRRRPPRLRSAATPWSPAACRPR